MKTNLQFLSKIKALTLLFMFFNFFIFAQTDSTKVQEEKKSFLSSFDIGVSFKSRYIWRGINLGGNAANIQPYIEYDFAKGFVVGTWGSYTFGDPPYEEVDIYLSYTTPNKKFSFILTDYFFPNFFQRDNNFFHYKKSAHVLELKTSFNLFEEFPLEFSVATDIYGTDKKLDDEGQPTDKQSFSTYIEANYSASIYTISLNFFAGVVLANKGEYYGDKENAFINLGFTASKAIKITDRFSLPIDASLIFNPSEEDIFLVFGLSL